MTRLQTIVVRGGGVTGWLAAVALARVGARVTVVDDLAEEDGAVVTRPAIRDLHSLLGIDEDEMLAASGGTMRLGTRFDGCTHAFGGFGLDIAGVPLYQLWLRARAAGQAIDLDDYNLAGLAMRLGRFAPPAADKRAMIDHGYQLDRRRYAAYLRGIAEARGVQRVVGGVEGDLIIDTVGGGDWSDHTPATASVEVDTAADSDLPPFDTVTALLHRVPLQHRTVYRMDGDEAALLAAVPGAIGPVRHSTRQPGRRLNCWTGNRVAIGAAAAVIHPSITSDLDLAVAGITALLGLLPDLGDSAPEAEAYNRIMDRHILAHQDFALLHRPTGDPTPTLRHHIALFAGRGHLPQDNAGGISAAEWLAVLLGRGIMPRSWDVRADAVDSEKAASNFTRLGGLFRQSAESMPRHADYIARHCPT